MELTHMSPKRPYLLRAFYDWLLDNQLTPHIVVDAGYHGVLVPTEFVHDGQIVLNIAPQAVGHFEITNDEVHFSARFGGVPRQVHVPIGAVLAVYARENGTGTMFEPEPAYDEPETHKPHAETKPKAVMQLVEETDEHHGNDDDKPPQPPKGRPQLRVVK